MSSEVPEIRVSDERVNRTLTAVNARAAEHDRSLFEQVRDSLAVAVPPEAGTLMYQLVRATRAAKVVELGMSLGVSTVYLAAAVRDNGGEGRVYTTEIDEAKIKQGRATLADAGVADLVEVLEGDALQTLNSVPDGVQFVLLDGWNESYLRVMKILEPKLAPGALVLADDVNLFGEGCVDFLEYVRDPANGYLSVNFPMGEGLELSMRVG
ncbi:O-methyltransferase [Streptomyces huiliensis]|uniref:O-methyltransferase n=1 Tax=Streptomyces huiliensis TaxID=2876027 RepID=UPI001CC0EE49|nr:class I SAM-dependent methyltransferase [Streptomyces huiliensis]MBZ4323748.1 class I SAM-dependent methyltransferase [Streptomyces huiliensis]